MVGITLAQTIEILNLIQQKVSSENLQELLSTNRGILEDLLETNFIGKINRDTFRSALMSVVITDLGLVTLPDKSVSFKKRMENANCIEYDEFNEKRFPITLTNIKRNLSLICFNCPTNYALVKKWIEANNFEPAQTEDLIAVAANQMLHEYPSEYNFVQALGSLGKNLKRTASVHPMLVINNSHGDVSLMIRTNSIRYGSYYKDTRFLVVRKDAV
ncbi:hypothetical protein ACFL1U_03030 [Patescibacteria group bacterium]